MKGVENAFAHSVMNSRTPTSNLLEHTREAKPKFKIISMKNISNRIKHIQIKANF
jgi:hypothetical protein